jgi:hypothetical protein
MVCLPTPLFSEPFTLGKRQQQNCCHSDSPYHAFAHCRGFAPAASRRTRALVSVPFWGPPLPWPLRIIGLVSHYLTNSLIHRSLILRRTGSNSPAVWVIRHSSADCLSRVSLSFPRLSASSGQIDHVLLSPTPPTEVCKSTCMA